MGCYFLLQGIFLTRGSNPGLPHCRQMFYHLSHQGSLNFFQIPVNVDILNSFYESCMFLMTYRMVNPFKKVFNFLCSDNLRKICIYGSYCFCSVAQSCPILATPWTIVCQASLSFAISWSLLNLMSIESVMPSNHLVLCRPLLLPSIFPINRVFSSESLFASGGQNIGTSASIPPMNIQD